MHCTVESSVSPTIIFLN